MKPKPSKLGFKKIANIEEKQILDSGNLYFLDK